MGTIHAMEYAAMGNDTALAAHLQSNHFPPVSLVFMDTAKEAIARAVEAETHGNPDPYGIVLTMPNGIEKTVGDIIEGLHLTSFVEAEVERLEWVSCLHCGLPIDWEDENDTWTHAETGLSACDLSDTVAEPSEGEVL